jgi:tRNA-dihydrouridine synthase B
MNIGNVEISGRTVLAPLAGITDLPFRLICKRMGASLVYTEMISAEGLIREQRATVSITKTDPAERPVAFQIFGNRPQSMAYAAKRCAELGADIVDINMGCPVRKVTKGGSGAALLKDTGLAMEVAGAVVEASPVPVTVKVRTGWTASEFVAAELARSFESAGVSAVAVHGRYAKQGFSGDADWSAIRRVREVVGIPVIGNGDVRTGEDAERMAAETGCDLVMIGRGALGNPWIFTDAQARLSGTGSYTPPTPRERGEVLIEHLRGVVGYAGERAGVRMMRKHGAWYSKGLTGAPDFRRLINKAETVAGYEDAVRGFFFGHGGEGR